MRLLSARQLGGPLLVTLRQLHIDTANILANDNRLRCVQALGQVKPLRLKTGAPEKKAAVLVPLCLVNGHLSLLYTVRSSNLRTNRYEYLQP
jgi:hypothetical protein